MKDVVRALCLAATVATLAGALLSPDAASAFKTTPPTAGDAPAGASAPGGGAVTGKVVETMNAGPYTYVLVDDGTKKIWAAAPKFTVAVGDQVSVPDGAPMQNFQSKTLNRTFDVVYFVGAIQVIGAAAGSGDAAAAHGDGGARIVAPTVVVSHLEKPSGGYTVADLFAKKSNLAGKEVVVRGKVAKATMGVMGKNWLHIQDGTGSEGSNDVTATTQGSAAVGDTVLVKGTLAADKDFGFGYKYDVLIENADVTVE